MIRIGLIGKDRNLLDKFIEKNKVKLISQDYDFITEPTSLDVDFILYVHEIKTLTVPRVKLLANKILKSNQNIIFISNRFKKNTVKNYFNDRYQFPRQYEQVIVESNNCSFNQLQSNPQEISLYLIQKIMELKFVNEIVSKYKSTVDDSILTPDYPFYIIFNHFKERPYTPVFVQRLLLLGLDCLVKNGKCFHPDHLSVVDEDIILSSRMTPSKKYYFLSRKDNVEIETLCGKSEISAWVNGKSKLFSSDNSLINIDFIKLDGHILHIEGDYYSDLEPVLGNNNVFIELSNGKLIKLDLNVADKNRIIYGSKVIKRNFVFRASIDISNVTSISFKEHNVNVKIRFGRYSGLTEKISSSYLIKSSFVFQPTTFKLLISPLKEKKQVQLEIDFLKEIYKKNKGACAYRLLYWLSKPYFKNKKNWLLMDRVENGNDNAEALFRYVVDKVKDAYFIVDKNSSTYQSLKPVGKVIHTSSTMNKLLHLHARYVISSHASDWAKNPFYKAEIFYRNLINYDFVFLQHGVIYNNVSRSANKHNIGASRFITSAKREQDSILQDGYLYSPKEVVLTGLPRYDYLDKSKAEKIILLCPTWRRGIVNSFKLGKKRYNRDFKKTEYFNRFNKLINDKRLLSKLELNGYKILFLLHEEIKVQKRDFKLNDYVSFPDDNFTYKGLFNQASLMITDYSSVFFDFCYMRKPVIYYQFDKEAFYGTHYNPGYFSFEKDNFGDVCFEHDEMVDSIIHSIDNKFNIDLKYKNKIDNFFEFEDKNNCKRVYEAILNMDKE